MNARHTWLIFFLTLLLPTAATTFAWQAVAETKETQQRVQERVAELLDLLEEQNRGNDRFKDAWVLTLKEIVEAGPAAAPLLIKELDTTIDDMMLRRMGLCLRAIGDKRAVPALIRAIPRTLRKPGSDMGFSLDSEALSNFMGEHDLNDKSNRDFTFGRPVREILGALCKISGRSEEDDQLYHIFLDGTARQQRMKKAFFHRHAQKWAEWWQANAAQQTEDEAYFKVDLPPREEEPETKLAKGKLQHYQLEGGSSGWILEPFAKLDADTVFFDFDTGRVAKLPAKWKDEKKLDAKFAEIEKWAADEGFDLMGAEYASPITGKSHFAIRPLGLEAWELGDHRWKMESSDITFESLISEGKSVSAWLLHRDTEEGKVAPDKTATFLFRTKEGTPGLLFVGIEVHNDSLQPGGALLADEDLELKTVAFNKGRRFGYKFFEEIEAK